MSISRACHCALATYYRRIAAMSGRACAYWDTLLFLHLVSTIRYWMGSLITSTRGYPSTRTTATARRFFFPCHLLIAHISAELFLIIPDSVIGSVARSADIRAHVHKAPDRWAGM